MKFPQPQLYDSILQRIRTRMDENKITQAQLGESLGIKQSAVSYLLKGKTKLNIEQFVVLANLLGTTPQELFLEAESASMEFRPMPSATAKVLYKSALHLLCHCAAARPVSAEEIANQKFTVSDCKKALGELVDVGLLVKKDDRYQQKELQVVQKASSREDEKRRDSRFLDVHQLCQDIWSQTNGNKEYRSTRFNYFMIDYFTPSQIKEVEEFLWRAYEKLRAYQRENIAVRYQAEQDFELWQSHLMLMTPLKDR